MRRGYDRGSGASERDVAASPDGRRSLAVARAHRTRQNYSTFPQSLMVTLADVFPLREPTASAFLTTS
jgi:hypothetical protein